MTQSTHALEVRNISKTYATVRAVESLSFEVHKGIKEKSSACWGPTALARRPAFA
jgi:ABC-type branched-subunit amino acid transport system ATPase component